MADTLKLENGKYTIVRDNDGRMHADRYDDAHWRDLTGDKLVGALVDRCLELEAKQREYETDTNKRRCQTCGNVVGDQRPHCSTCGRTEAT